MTVLTRRAFLSAAAALAPVADAFARQTAGPAAGATAPVAISRDEFMRLSQRLVQRPPLDAQVGAVYLDALLAVPGNGPILARLARGPAGAGDAAGVALERTIIECWYTGIYTRGGDRRVATHTGALMWNAAGAATPGVCRARFGEWSQPPKYLG